MSIPIFYDPLYVRYTNQSWELFKQKPSNFYLYHMLLLFIGSGLSEYTFINFPHIVPITATLKKVGNGHYTITIDNIMTEYMYSSEQHIYSL